MKNNETALNRRIHTLKMWSGMNGVCVLSFEENHVPDLQALIEQCEEDTRRVLEPLAARRLGNWRRHAAVSENALVKFSDRVHVAAALGYQPLCQRESGTVSILGGWL